MASRRPYNGGRVCAACGVEASPSVPVGKCIPSDTYYCVECCERCFAEQYPYGCPYSEDLIRDAEEYIGCMYGVKNSQR